MRAFTQLLLAPAIVMALAIALIVLLSSGWVMPAKRDEPPCS